MITYDIDMVDGLCVYVYPSLILYQLADIIIMQGMFATSPLRIQKHTNKLAVQQFPKFMHKNITQLDVLQFAQKYNTMEGTRFSPNSWGARTLYKDIYGMGGA